MIGRANETDATIPRIEIPCWLLENSDQMVLDIGEREALSTLMGIYAYSPDITHQMRNTQKLLQLTQAYLVKTARWSGRYAMLYKDLWKSWSQGALYLNSPQDFGIGRIIFSDIETIVTIIAKIEGFTQDSKELYDGRTGLEVTAPPAEDAYGI